MVMQYHAEKKTINSAPTSTQPPCLRFLVNEYQQKLGSKRAHHTMH